jgi:hypothetical protein
MASTGKAMLMSAMGSSLSGSRNSSVSMIPGLTTCTFTSVSARSMHIASDHAVSAAFDAAYAASVPGPSRPAIDEMFTIRPPRSMSPGSNASVRRTGDE